METKINMDGTATITGSATEIAHLLGFAQLHGMSSTTELAPSATPAKRGRKPGRPAKTTSAKNKIRKASGKSFGDLSDEEKAELRKKQLKSGLSPAKFLKSLGYDARGAKSSIWKTKPEGKASAKKGAETKTAA